MTTENSVEQTVVDGSAKDDSGLRWIATALAALLAILALAAAIVFGFKAYKIYFVEKPIQTARDDSVDAAETAILNITTIDPRNTAEWKKRVDASLTGKAAEQITKDSVNQLNSQIASAGAGQAATLTSRLKRSAATEVNADDGKATVLVFVDATSKRENEAGVTQTMGFQVSMTRADDDRWLADNITPTNAMPLEENSASSGGTSGGATTSAPATTTQEGGN